MVVKRYLLMSYKKAITLTMVHFRKQNMYLKNGINKVKNYEINILELGFGTGLNALVNK